MAKRSNNSLGRRAYGGKPYDANNSFVKKMANKVGDFIPQRSWISKWFNTSQDNGDANACDGENHEDAETEDDARQPPAKRPRIRMDVTHPPGTFFIRPRDRDSSNENDSRKDPFSRSNETEQDFLEPATAGPSGIGRFISSTPAVQTDIRNSNMQRAELNCLIPSENNGASNGADDNSESSESTSGCSSLIPQTNRQEGTMNAAYHTNLSNRKRLIDDKLAFGNHLQSPRCLFLDSNSRESLSSRRPSFNASMMNSSNSTLDRASSLSSPFYSGNVTFGGANALGHYKRSRSFFNNANEFQLKVPRRTSVQVKPSSAECIDASGMSQTAKRILEAMEYFSSPISDAKKIPVKKLDTSAIGGRKRSRDEQQVATPTARVGLRHLTRELAVPTVPEMLKLRRRQKLQDTTVAARKIVSAMSGPPPGSSATVTSRSAVDEYHLPTELDQDQKYRGKLRTTSKKNPKEVEPTPSLNLPQISLAITSLPSFEPLPKFTKPPNRETVAVPKEKDTSSGYKFASPIKLSEAAWNLKSINNFSFSKPINAEDKDDSREYNFADTTTSSTGSSSPALSGLWSKYLSAGGSLGATNATSSVDGAATNFMWTSSSTAPRLKVKTKPDKKTGKGSESSIANQSSELKFGSVMDILGGKTSIGENNETGSLSQKTSPRASNFVTASKPLVNIWECAECYIKNDSSEKICVACKASKPSSTREKRSSPTNTITSNAGAPAAQQPRNDASSSDCFGSQFKMNTNQWECSSCLLRNKQVDLVCVACTSPKPNNTVPTSNAIGSTSQQSTAKSDLLDKFKPAEGSWECPGCMLRNPSAVITCPCCNASKPSLLNIGPKKPSVESSANDKTNKSSDLMDKFKPSTSSWECSSCLVRNTETSSACVCCSAPRPGVSSKTSSSSTAATTTNSATAPGWGDKFKKPEGAWSCDSCMLQNKSDVTECVACGGLKPGATRSAPKVAASTFTFGIPANAQNSTSATKTETGSSNGFSFGVKSSTVDANSAGSQFSFGIPPSEAEKNKSSSTIGEKPTGFVFATPKSADAGPAWGSGFKFGAPTNASETADAAKPSASQEKKETFSFGLPKSVSAPTASDDKETIFGSSSAIGNGKPRSAFGGDTNKAATNASTTNTTFGVATTDKSITAPTAFGNDSSQKTSGNETKIDADNSTKSNNSESEKRPATITDSLTSANPSLASTASTAFSTETRPSFTFSEPNSKLRSQTTISSGFGGASMSAPAPVASSTFSMAAPKASEANLNSDNKQSTMSSFGVGAAPMSSPFGAAANSSPSPSPALGESTIGAKSTVCPAFGSNASKTTFFGMPEEKKPSAFGSMEKKNTIFGSVENKQTPSALECNDKSTSNSIFNNTHYSDGFSTGAIRPAQPPLFGSTATPVFGNSAAPSFGTPTTAATSNIFGTGKIDVTSTAPTSTGIFTFGAATPQASAAPTPITFNFSGGGTPANTAAKPIFPFGGATPQTNECFAGTGASVGGTFGAPSTLNTAPSPFTFNAPAKQEPPSFGQATTAIPSMFGAQPTAPSIGQSQPASTFLPNPPAASTGFNFGASSQTANTGGFNFGGNMTQQPQQQQPASAPSSGFNFNATAPPAFDPNAPLSFNFTGGSAPTAFNATPQQPAQTRRIKKAVRRMPQR